MQILNPIYDVVFKYLMEDNKIAKLFLSALIEEDIVELEFLPQEYQADFDGLQTQSNKKEKTISWRTGLTVYRIDFSAKIKQTDGSEKLIIIEVQKSRLSSDLMRFRNYIGHQYAKKEYFKWVTDQNSIRQFKAGIPIYAIFFLGYGLNEYADIPIIQIDTCIKDKYNALKLEERGHFIPSLFHKGIIINIPYLKEKYRTDLERLLSIFDQNNKSEVYHILNVKEEYFAKKYRPIIKRLQAGLLESSLRNQVLAEEDLLTDLVDLEEQNSAYKKEMTEMKQEIERLEKEKQQEKIKSILLLIDMGVSVEVIKEKMQVDDNFLKQILPNSN
jgi:hypothetical protein